MIENDVIPASRVLSGFNSGYWLIDRVTGKLLALTIFETEENIQAMIEGPPTTDSNPAQLSKPRAAWTSWDSGREMFAGAPRTMTTSWQGEHLGMPFLPDTAEKPSTCPTSPSILDGSQRRPCVSGHIEREVGFRDRVDDPMSTLQGLVLFTSETPDPLD
jgi:hypothetical protein